MSLRPDPPVRCQLPQWAVALIGSWWPWATSWEYVSGPDGGVPSTSQIAPWPPTWQPQPVLPSLSPCLHQSVLPRHPEISWNNQNFLGSIVSKVAAGRGSPCGSLRVGAEQLQPCPLETVRHALAFLVTPVSCPVCQLCPRLLPLGVLGRECHSEGAGKRWCVGAGVPQPCSVTLL